VPPLSALSEKLPLQNKNAHKGAVSPTLVITGLVFINFKDL